MAETAVNLSASSLPDFGQGTGLGFGLSQVPDTYPDSRRGSLDGVPIFDCSDPQFCTDEFRMYEMKIRRCPKSRPHDWTTCPFAHPGEKAKRRDPRKIMYSATSCAEYRKSGQCTRGDACIFSHGVFECWLHPHRYRTQLCTDGLACNRKVCFFAHTPTELRIVPASPGTVQDQNLQQAIPQLPGHVDRQRSQQEEAITAAAQMLDPLAKARLVQALQGLQGAPGIATPNLEDNGQLSRTTLLQALQELSLQGFLHPAGGPNSRRSFDSSMSYSTSNGVMLHRSQSTSYPLSASSYPSNPSGMPNINSNSNSNVTVNAPGVNPSNSFGINLSRRSIDIGSLYHSNESLASLDREAGDRARMALPLPALSALHGIPNGGTILNGGGAPLGRIDELFGVEDDEKSSCSVPSSCPRSGSASSSFGDSASSATGTATGTANANGGVPSAYLHPKGKNGEELTKMARIFSFDNILANLPRSASQVNMIDASEA